MERSREISERMWNLEITRNTEDEYLNGYLNPFYHGFSKMEIDWEEVDLLDINPSYKWRRQSYKLGLSTWHLDQTEHLLTTSKIRRAKKLLLDTKRSKGGMQYHLWKITSSWLQTLSESWNPTLNQYWASVPKVFIAAEVLNSQNTSNWQLGKKTFDKLVDMMTVSCNKSRENLAKWWKRVAHGRIATNLNRQNNKYDISERWTDISPLGMAHFYAGMLNWELGWHEDLIKLMFYCHSWQGRISKYISDNIAVWHKTWSWKGKVHDSGFLNINWEYYTLSVIWATNPEDIALLTAAILDEQGIQKFN